MSSEDVERFNRDVAAMPPPPDKAASSEGATRFAESQCFREYRVTKQSGMLTLPVSARRDWGLADGGIVHVAHLHDYVVVVRNGAWGDILRSWRLDESLSSDLDEEIRRRNGGAGDG